jgi:methionyl-tRNA formyltransferase
MLKPRSLANLKLSSLRGSAPIHRAIMYGRTHTGVSLQSLDEQAFDHGVVLAQTPLPGIPVPDDCTTQRLRDMMTPVAAKMLVDGLRAGVHVPPYEDVGWKPDAEEAKALKKAFKLSKHHRQIKWSDWSAQDIDRRRRA